MSRTYKVQAGDTLSGIAQRYYGDSTLFGLIATANQLADPNKITVGQVVAIPDIPKHWDVVQVTWNSTISKTGFLVIKVPCKVPAGMRLVIETVSARCVNQKGMLSPMALGEVNEPLEMFTFSSGLLSTAPTAQTRNVFLYPGTSPMISTDGTNSVVWALDLHAYVGGTPDGTVNTSGPAVLHAYDGSTLQELYNSAQAGTRGQAGKALKFTSPTIANGHVYVGTANALNVYGLLP